MSCAAQLSARASLGGRSGGRSGGRGGECAGLSTGVAFSFRWAVFLWISISPPAKRALDHIGADIGSGVVFASSWVLSGTSPWPSLNPPHGTSRKGNVDGLKKEKKRGGV